MKPELTGGDIAFEVAVLPHDSCGGKETIRQTKRPSSGLTEQRFSCFTQIYQLNQITLLWKTMGGPTGPAWHLKTLGSTVLPM